MLGTTERKHDGRTTEIKTYTVIHREQHRALPELLFTPITGVLLSLRLPTSSRQAQGRTHENRVNRDEPMGSQGRKGEEIRRVGANITGRHNMGRVAKTEGVKLEALQ